MKRRCENCDFSKPANDLNNKAPAGNLVCSKKPPVVMPIGDSDFRTSYPIVPGNWICGDHKIDPDFLKALITPESVAQALSDAGLTATMHIDDSGDRVSITGLMAGEVPAHPENVKPAPPQAPIEGSGMEFLKATVPTPPETPQKSSQSAPAAKLDPAPAKKVKKPTEAKGKPSTPDLGPNDSVYPQWVYTQWPTGIDSKGNETVEIVWPSEDRPFITRSTNVLTRERLAGSWECWRDFLSLKDSQKLKLKGFGKKCLKDIASALGAVGVSQPKKGHAWPEDPAVLESEPQSDGPFTDY